VTAANPTQFSRWRRVRARLDAGKAPEPEDAIWLASACRETIEVGTPLREAFGLPCRGGAGGLQRVALLARRDAMLRDLYEACFHGLGVRRAAREIAALADRQARSHRPPRNDSERRMLALVQVADLPSERRIREVLARSKAV
jgi:hypothetical protein